MNKIKPFDIIIFISILVFSAFLIKNSFSGKNKNTVTVNADGVTDPNELADIVADKIDRAIKKERAVFV